MLLRCLFNRIGSAELKNNKCNLTTYNKEEAEEVANEVVDRFPKVVQELAKDTLKEVINSRKNKRAAADSDDKESHQKFKA